MLDLGWKEIVWGQSADQVGRLNNTLQVNALRGTFSSPRSLRSPLKPYFFDDGTSCSPEIRARA